SDAVGLAVTARSHRKWTWWAVVAAVLLGAALFFAIRLPSNFPSAVPISFAVFPPEGTVFSAAINRTLNVPQFALSPDAGNLVFAAEVPGTTPMLWVRTMKQVSPRQLTGTEEAQFPFWSPDSRWIGFFAQGNLKKVPAAGGPVQIITQAAANFGGTWGPQDNILFGNGNQPILQVKSSGGKSTPVTTLDISREVVTHRNPYFLPDGNHFLYSFFGRATDQNGVYLGSLNDRNKTLLIRQYSNAVYVPPGYLLFVDGDILHGQSFDLQHLQLNGQPFFVPGHVGA